MLVGVEKALTDKEAGEKFSVTLQPEDTCDERKKRYGTTYTGKAFTRLT